MLSISLACGLRTKTIVARKIELLDRIDDCALSGGVV
jgi:hypothetical protein